MFFCLVMVAGSIFKQQRDSIRGRIALLERSQQLEREIINISEREQQRIGRDLHDGVCQYLAAIGFTAAMLNRDLERESSIRAETAGEIANLLQDAASERATLLEVFLLWIEMRAASSPRWMNWRRALQNSRESRAPSFVLDRYRSGTMRAPSICFESPRRL